MSLQKKVAIVTGASRGIGKAIAFALSKEGACVVVAARSEIEGRLPGTIHKTVEEIRALGGDTLAIRADITKEEEINEMIRKTLDHYGRIDVLVNNAGIAMPGTIAETSTKRWDLVMAVNLRSAFLCTKAALPSMMNQRSGSIINLSSIMGTRAIAGSIPYGVTKAAIERFTLGLAQEIKEYGIAVNALCPSHTDTEGSRMMNPDRNHSSFQSVEVWGKYAAFLAHQSSSTLTGKCFIAEEIEGLIQKDSQ